MNVILVTGATEGLGREIARRCSPKHTVVITSRDETRLAKASEELQCDGVIMDVKDPASVERTVNQLVEKYKKIDCLINNAGIWVEGPLEDNNNETICDVIETNLLGTIYASRAVIPSMKARKSGLIININSENGLRTKKERSVYVASKWGVTGFTASIQEELAPHGIRVTGIHPAKMRTRLFAKAGVEKKLDDALDVGRIADVIDHILSLPNNVMIPQISIKAL